MLFSCTYRPFHHISSFEETVYSEPLLLNYDKLFILDINLLHDCKSFLLFCGLSFFFMTFFDAQKFLIFMISNVCFFFFFCLCFWSCILGHGLIQGHTDLPLSSSKGCTLIAFALTFRSLSHLVHLQFSCVHIQLYQHYLLKTLLFPWNCLGTLVEDQWAITVRVYFWTLNFIPLIYMSIHTLVPHCLDV